MSEATLFHLGPPELQQAGFFACQWCVLAAHMVTIQPRASVTPGNGPPGTSVNLMESPVFPTCHALSKSTTARWRQHGYWKKPRNPKAADVPGRLPHQQAWLTRSLQRRLLQSESTPLRHAGRAKDAAVREAGKTKTTHVSQDNLVLPRGKRSRTHTRALATGLTDESRSLGLRQPSQVPLHPAR